MGLWAILSAIVALAGPFGTYDRLPLAARFLYWGTLIGVAVPVATALRLCVDRWFERMAGWLRSVLVAALFAGIFTPLVFIATLWLQLRGLAQVVPMWQMVVITLLSALAVCVLRSVVGGYDAGGAGRGRADVPEAPVPQSTANPPAPRLLDRLPRDVRGDLVAITVRDHYVDVQTSRGTASLLMRLSDAIAEVESVPGAQVHRSYWVAWAAVVGVESTGGSVALQLDGGRRIPVSRANRAKLEARGLI